MNTQQQPKQSNEPKTRIPPSIWLLGGGVAVLLVLMAVIIGLNSAKTRTAAEKAHQAAMATQASALNLPPISPEDLKTLRANEAQILTSYDWVDKDAGIVRIPINKAMDLALEQADYYYKQWAVEENVSATGGSGSLAEAGLADFNSLGCNACHQLDASGDGPALGAIFGTQVELESGKTVTVDEKYLRTSILAPADAVVKGFAPIMPSFEGLVSEDQLNQLIAYIKSTGGSGNGAQPNGGAPSAAQGEKLFAAAGCSACHAVDTVLVGPALGNLYGEKTTLESGETITVDEAYLRESILNPGAKIVKGFVGAMPPFEGILSDAEISSLIEYIKSLSSAQ